MDSLLNPERPPVFCPGCSHGVVTRALDRAFQMLGLAGNQVALVSDIGCSGLFDTFFNTHALHGLHGRALTYATGIKMARPDLTVVVTMGDGGLGIGGAHLLSTCRRNIDLTLLVLNNFNYGMTGGQSSPTTPAEATVGSGFLNRLEKPFDPSVVAVGAGAAWTERASAHNKELAGKIAEAIQFEGFSLLDIWGVCPGRYTKKNPLTPSDIQSSLAKLPDLKNAAEQNRRKEFARHYGELALTSKPAEKPVEIEVTCSGPDLERKDILILGKAGQRVVTAGELLGLAAMSAGFYVTQKNDYPITVLRGHSVSELIVSKEPVGYTGISRPDIVIVLAEEGVNRKRSVLENLGEDTLIVKAASVKLPAGEGMVENIDYKAMNIKPADWALAALAVLANRERALTGEMLKTSLTLRFSGKVLASSLEVVDRVEKYFS